MSPEITVGLYVLLGTVGAALLTFFGVIVKAWSDRRSAGSSDLANRFDDASELTKYIDARVEEKVAPIRAELAKVKSESHEMHDAVRAHFTQLWMWDRAGRSGPLPMLPDRILHRLGLGHLLDVPPEDTEPLR